MRLRKRLAQATNGPLAITLLMEQLKIAKRVRATETGSEMQMAFNQMRKHLPVVVLCAAVMSCNARSARDEWLCTARSAVFEALVNPRPNAPYISDDAKDVSIKSGWCAPSQIELAWVEDITFKGVAVYRVSCSGKALFAARYNLHPGGHTISIDPLRDYPTVALPEPSCPPGRSN